MLISGDLQDGVAEIWAGSKQGVKTAAIEDFQRVELRVEGTRTG